MTNSDDAVAVLTPLVANRSQAWNVWNTINRSDVFVAAFLSLHAPDAEQIERALVRDWHQDQCGCREFDGVDINTCYTRTEVFRKSGAYVMVPPMTWTVEAVLSVVDRG